MSEYFSHDYDAREDEKIMDLMGEMGWAGYGLFWGLIELLYKNKGKMRTQYERIAFALNSHPDSVKSVIENFGLFTIRYDFFSSKSVNARLKKRLEKSDKARANAYKRWEKDDANAMQPQSKRNAKKESKVKNIKVKENKETIPSFEEFKTYAIEKKPTIETQALKLKYESWIENEWKDGNDNKIVNWKSKLLNTIPYLKEKIVAPGRNPKSENAPDNFGIPSKTAVPMPDRLKKRFDNIGKL